MARSSIFNHRQWRWVGLVAFVVLVMFWRWPSGQVNFGKDVEHEATEASTVKALEKPPTWDKLRQWERNLPQHNLSLPLPEGKDGRYVLFSNQIFGLGWNNQLNEILMLTHLAYKSKRAYVYKESSWERSHYPFKIPGGQEPRTPLNALLSGPSAGGPWDPSDDAPRSITEAWYEVVCPREKRRVINTREVKPSLTESPGNVVFDTWQKVLEDAPEGCVEVQGDPDDGRPQIFDLWVFGSERCISLWDYIKNSPVSRLLGTSPVVQAAVDRNEFLFRPRGPRPPVAASNNPYDRMLSLHLRRGDYKSACEGFATWNSTFYNWNLLPFLPDRFDAPKDYTYGKATPEGLKTYLEHCYPTDEQILNKIRTARDEYIAAAPKGKPRFLDVIFLLTNDKSEWVKNIKEAFKKDGWTTIVTTQDLELVDSEQKEVGMAVDMDLARKAAVFIGNGWSSFTSNIVHRRLVDGKEPISTRFF